MSRDCQLPSVTVTMAAYNVASYVEACLDSILAQDWVDFELIIVDDASTDGTREILQAYAGEDSRIRLFLKEKNEGLAVARNLGIAEARGEWVTFLDADDLYSPEMLRLAIETGRAHKAEMVLWDFVVFSDEAEISGKADEPSALTGVDPANRLALLDRPAFAWTRLVRRATLARLQISFPPGLTYQDVPVHYKLVTLVDDIALVPKRVAYYRQHPAATTTGKSWKRADFFYALDLVEVFLNEADQLSAFSDTFTGLQLRAWFGVYDVITPQFHERVKSMTRERFTDRHRAYLQARKPLHWQARAFYRALDGDGVAHLALAAWSAARSVYRQLKARG